MNSYAGLPGSIVGPDFGARQDLGRVVFLLKFNCSYIALENSDHKSWPHLDLLYFD